MYSVEADHECVSVGGIFMQALAPPTSEVREPEDAEVDLEAETRRLDYEFFDQLDCLDLSDSSSCYEADEGAD